MISRFVGSSSMWGSVLTVWGKRKVLSPFAGSFPSPSPDSPWGHRAKGQKVKGELPGGARAQMCWREGDGGLRGGRQTWRRLVGLAERWRWLGGRPRGLWGGCRCWGPEAVDGKGTFRKCFYGLEIGRLLILFEHLQWRPQVLLMTRGK